MMQPEPSFDDDELRRFLESLGKSDDDRFADAQTYLKCRVRLRNYLRMRGMKIESVIENAVDRTFIRVLAERAKAYRGGAFSSREKALRWLFTLADKETQAELRSQDEVLVERMLHGETESLAQKLGPSDDLSEMPHERAGKLLECIRRSIEHWLNDGRRSSRQTAFAMLLRFEFTGVNRSYLASVYARASKEAVGQRNHATRSELASITAHCFEQYSAPDRDPGEATNLNATRPKSEFTSESASRKRAADE